MAKRVKSPTRRTCTSVIRRCSTKIEHIAHDIWEDEKTAHKRPANSKLAETGGSAEKAAVAVDSRNKVEFLLCSMCFPNHANTLSDPNVWIADTVATVHSMPSDAGFTNIKGALKLDLVVMGNGVDVGAVKLAQLPGVVCDKKGHELHEATLDKVMHLPAPNFHLTVYQE
jgi:hypothetical protein